MKHILFIVFVFFQGFILAQLEKNYTPLVSSLPIPEEFKKDVVDLTKDNVESNTVLSKKEALAFYSKMNFIKFQLFKSGQIYLTNTLTKYIDSVKTSLLITEPQLQGKINVYLTRFSQSNAFCFPDGSIFINIGLIARLENRSELAFILAHEIAHYSEQHNIKDLRRLSEIQKQEFNINNRNASAHRSLKFSRESEFDADSWAMQLMHQAGYDAGLAAKALERIKNLEELQANVDFEKFFGNQYFTVDTAWISAKAITRNKSYYGEDDSDPITSGKLSDLFQTHPDIDKRIDAVNVIFRSMKKKQISSDNGSFSSLRELAEFETIESNYQEQDYVNSILNSIHLLKRYPNNEYLHANISRSLYWLSYYKELKTDNLVIAGTADQNGFDFYKLFSLINEMGLKECKKMAYSYSLKKYEEDSEKESYLFYLALNADNYIGKNAAKNYYKDYLAKYPKGDYINVTKLKLQ